MRRYLFAVLCLPIACVGLTACSCNNAQGEGPMEQSGKAVDKAAEKTGEVIQEGVKKVGEGAEKVGEKMQGTEQP